MLFECKCMTLSIHLLLRVFLFLFKICYNCGAVGPESLVEGEDYLHSDCERDGSNEEFLSGPALAKGIGTVRLATERETAATRSSSPGQPLPKVPPVVLYSTTSRRSQSPHHPSGSILRGPDGHRTTSTLESTRGFKSA